MSTAVEFWHQHLGRHLCDLPTLESTGAMIPHRTLKGIQSLRIGQIDLFYIASPKETIVIGRVEQEGIRPVKSVASETVSGRKFIAQWLVDHAAPPYMVGVVGRARPHESMRVTQHLMKSYFCEAGAGFAFNLETVRRARTRMGDLPWKKIMAPAIHQYEKLRHADHRLQVQERKRMNALLEETPELRNILPELGVLPNSGEYQILSWLNMDSVGQQSVKLPLSLAQS